MEPLASLNHEVGLPVTLTFTFSKQKPNALYLIVHLKHDAWQPFMYFPSYNAVRNSNHI